MLVFEKGFFSFILSSIQHKQKSPYRLNIHLCQYKLWRGKHNAKPGLLSKRNTQALNNNRLANEIINKQVKSVILDFLQIVVIYASKWWRQVSTASIFHSR